MTISGKMARQIAICAAFLAASSLNAVEPPVAADTHRGALVRHRENPEYPKAAADKGLTGSVDAEARVHGSEILTEVSIKPDGPESAIFVPAVERALAHWRVRPPLDDCFPSSEKVGLRFQFSMEDGKPAVSVGTLKGWQRREPSVPDHLKPDLRARPMIYIGDSETDVAVYSKMTIDPMGKVQEVSISAYHSDPPSASKEHAAKVAASGPDNDGLRTIVRKTSLAVYRWHFPPAPEGMTGPRFACAPFYSPAFKD